MSRGRQYVLGTAFGLVAALMRYALIPLWGTKYPFFTFYPAVMLAAWYGGSGAGIAGLAVASIGAWFFIEPVGFVPLRGIGDVLAWALFVAVNLVMLFSSKPRTASGGVRTPHETGHGSAPSSFARPMKPGRAWPRLLSRPPMRSSARLWTESSPAGTAVPSGSSATGRKK